MSNKSDYSESLEYCKFNDIKKQINKGIAVREYYQDWFNNLEDTFDYLDQSEYYDETPDFDNPSDFEDTKSFVHDMVKSLKLFDKYMNLENKKSLKLLCGKIVSYNLFAERIDIQQSDLLGLLNFVKWDFEILCEYAEEWVTSEESGGSDIVTLMKLAKKHNKKIQGYRESNTVYCLLMAVKHCRDTDAENFIIKNKIKLTKKLKKSNDGLIDDMIDYFKEEREYDLD